MIWTLLPFALVALLAALILVAPGPREEKSAGVAKDSQDQRFIAGRFWK